MNIFFFVTIIFAEKIRIVRKESHTEFIRDLEKLILAWVVWFRLELIFTTVSKNDNHLKNGQN